MSHNLDELPVQHVAFYLSREEMQELRQYTNVRAKRCAVEISTKTATLTFQTNTTSTQVGNNNLGVYLIKMDDDYHVKRNGYMEKDQGNIIKEIFWGEHISKFATLSDPPLKADNVAKLGAQYVVRNFDNKFVHTMPQFAVATGGFSQLQYVSNPMVIDNFIAERRNASMQEGHFISWEHTCDDGILYGMHSLSTIPTGGHTQQTGNLRYNCQQPFNYSHGASAQTTAKQSTSHLQDNSGSITSDVGITAAHSLMLPHLDLEDTEENDLDMLIQDRNNINTKSSMKPLIFGIETLTGINKLEDIAGVVPCHIELYVNVLMEVDVQQGVDYLPRFGGSLRQPDFIHPNRCIAQVTTSNDKNDPLVTGEYKLVRERPGTKSRLNDIYSVFNKNIEQFIAPANPVVNSGRGILKRNKKSTTTDNIETPANKTMVQAGRVVKLPVKRSLYNNLSDLETQIVQETVSSEEEIY
jgi:hypothetical protein